MISSRPVANSLISAGIERVDHAPAAAAVCRAARCPFSSRPRARSAWRSVEERLARGDDADCGAVAEVLNPVQPVGLRVGARHRQPDALPAPLHVGQVGLQHAGGDAVLEPLPVPRHLRIDGRDAVAVDQDPPGAVGDVGDDLQRDPQPAGTGHRHGVHAQVEHVLWVSRVQDRHPEVGQQQFGGAGDGRRLRAPGSSPDERHRAAARVRAHQVRVPHRVRRAVQAGRLAVPVPGHAADPGVARVRRQLGPLDRGRGQFLVHPGPEYHVERFEQRPLPLQLEVVTGRAESPRTQR